MEFKKLALATFVAAALTGCGGDDDSSPSESAPSKVTAQFIDSAVSGLDYVCDTDETGMTDEEGYFTVTDGASCQFSLDGFDIGSTEITAEQPVVTPYETTDSVEEAMKIASLLQTADADGDPDNGISVEEFDGGDELPENLLELTEDEFIDTVAEATDTPPEDVVTPEDAKKHMDENVGVGKGYHSLAVEEIVKDIQDTAADLEAGIEVDFENKLSGYHAALNAGDDSNGADIETFEALLTIAEVMNNEYVKERVSYDGEFWFGGAAEVLPNMLEAQFNNSIYAVFEPTIQGSTDDVSETLFELAQALIDASEKLGISFKDPSYVAMYNKKDDAYHLNFQDAQVIRTGALLVANMLTTSAAYSFGSDDYYIEQTDTVEVEVIKVKQDDYCDEKPFEYVTQNVQVEYSKADVYSVDFQDDETVYSLRDNPKYLDLANDSLKAAAEVALKVELEAILDEDELDQIPYIEGVLESLNTHMNSEDGVSTPFSFEDDGIIYNVNLQAFYNLETGIDRNDFVLETNEIICEEGDSVYDEGSKVASDSVCKPTEEIEQVYDLYNNNFVWIFSDADYAYYLNGYKADHELEWVPSESGDFNNILLSCQERTDEEVKDIACGDALN